MIPYGHQSINDDDVRSVEEVLRSDWLTQGPKVDEFEKILAEYCGARYAVVFCNGTAALQAAYFAAGFAEGDEFITSPMTFAATANAGMWFGARPVFADIDPRTGNLDASAVEKLITHKTKAIVPVDYSGLPADYDSFRTLAKKHGVMLIEDACHSLGASYKGEPIGSLSAMTIFSFHPVKIITTGEGGAVATNDQSLYEKLKLFRSHGITKDKLFHTSPGGWYYEMQDLGQNFRLTDMQCALGISQMKRIDQFIAKRREIAKRYTEAFTGHSSLVTPQPDEDSIQSSWHLYVLRLLPKAHDRRGELFEYLKNKGVGVQVHYIPVYYHPYYQRLGYAMGLCPNAEAWYDGAISLPLFPDLRESDQRHVIESIVSFFN